MTRRFGHPGLLLVLVAVLCVPRPAAAVLESCAVSATAVSFGSYDPLAGSAAEITGEIEVTCTVRLLASRVIYEVQLATGGSGTYAMREMTSGSGTLDYQLYTDASRTTVWGDGTGGTVTHSFNGILIIGTTTHRYSVHGAIPAGQNVAAGSYSDVITVTLNYD